MQKNYILRQLQNFSFQLPTYQGSVLEAFRRTKHGPAVKPNRVLQQALLIIFILLFLPAVMFAQDGDDGEGTDENYIRRGGIDSDLSGSRLSLYAKGDQTFCISAGLLLPLFFVNNDGTIISGYGEGQNDMHVKLGGTGSLSYARFLTPRIFLGGEIQASFAGTLAEKLLFFVPIGVKAGYQFLLGRFEFPLSVMLGMATHMYSVSGDPRYWGLFVRPQASAFFRFNNDWSFGLNVGWWWAPEWTKEAKNNVDGHFIDIMLAPRYHF
jgi:hypothetical protein